MAMSRSFGARSLTTFPPIRSSPALMSSRPAIMFSVVDFPQPDGPTRMTNSPSPMERLASSTASRPSGKRLVTWSNTMSAMPGLSLHRAGRQPGHDPTLEQQHENDDRDGDDDGRRRDRTDRLGELRRPGEERDGGRDGPRLLRRGQGDGEQEVVPAE